MKFDLKKEFEKASKKQVDKKVEEIIDSLAMNTPIDTGRARNGWRREGDKIVNDVEYIDKLNAGSSKQAPAFFIEKTLLSHEGVKPNGIIVKSE